MIKSIDHAPPVAKQCVFPSQTADTYTLFYVPDNASLIVRMALRVLQLPFQCHMINRSHNAHKAPAYLAINPQGQIPGLLAPGQSQAIFETGAILLYLGLQHQALLPTGAEQGRGLKWLFFLSNTLHSNLRMVFYPEQYASPSDSTVHIQRICHCAQQQVQHNLHLIETDLARKAQSDSYWLGHTLSVCDLYLATCVRWSQLYPPGNALASVHLQAQFPQLWRLLQKLEQLPVLQAACAEESIYGNFFSAPQIPQLKMYFDWVQSRM